MRLQSRRRRSRRGGASGRRRLGGRGFAGSLADSRQETAAARHGRVEGRGRRGRLVRRGGLVHAGAAQGVLGLELARNLAQARRRRAGHARLAPLHAQPEGVDDADLKHIESETAHYTCGATGVKRLPFC